MYVCVCICVCVCMFCVCVCVCACTLQNHIFVDGTQALQHEFRSLLNRHGHPVPPVIIVDMLSSEEGKSSFVYTSNT